MFPYKSWAVVTKGGFHVSGLLEVVDKAKAQLGADDTGPHKISCDLLSADLAFPEKNHNTYIVSWCLKEETELWYRMIADEPDILKIY